MKVCIREDSMMFRSCVIKYLMTRLHNGRREEELSLRIRYLSCTEGAGWNSCSAATNSMVIQWWILFGLIIVSFWGRLDPFVQYLFGQMFLFKVGFLCLDVITTFLSNRSWSVAFICSALIDSNWVRANLVKFVRASDFNSVLVCCRTMSGSGASAETTAWLLNIDQNWRRLGFWWRQSS